MADVLHSGTSITGGHANVVAAGAAGFMTGADKTKIDALPASQAAIQTLIDASVNAKVFPAGAFFSNGNPGTTSTRWMPRAGSAAVATAASGALYITAPMAMTAVTLTATYANATQATDSITYTLEVGGTPSALTVTLSPGTPSAQGTHAGIAIAQGDSLSIRVVQSGSTASTAGSLVGVTLGCKSP